MTKSRITTTTTPELKTEAAPKTKSTREKIVGFGGQVAEEGFKIGAVGFIVSAGLFPLDVILQGLHTHKGPHPMRALFKNFNFSYASAGYLAKIYACSAKMALFKNATLNQRSKLLPKENEALEENNQSNKASLTQITTISAIISAADTTLSQYHANQRVWKIHNNNQAPPKAHTPKDFLRQALPGYPIRFTRNTIMVGGLLISSNIKEALDKSHPSTNNSFLSAALTGAVTGVVSTPLDIFYKNQVIYGTSLYKTGKTFVEANGAAALIRGYPVAVGYTILAYWLVAKAGKEADCLTAKIKESKPSIVLANKSKLPFYSVHQFFQKLVAPYNKFKPQEAPKVESSKTASPPPPSLKR